jgi:hypothetical protein
MNNKVLNKQDRPKRNLTNDMQTLIFVISAAAITLGLILYALFSIFKPFEYKSFDSIQMVNEDNYLAQEGNENKEYYVFIYQQNDYRNEMLEKGLIRYANYAKKNKDARPIYRLDFGNDFYDKLKNALGYTQENYQTNLPTLVYVKNGKISSKYNTVSTISTELEGKMK